ncbi:MAG: YdcF family protein [Alcaligenaceae bacterium]|nr:YdcF family protein [Alcaligenaceae bacterium]
MSEFISLVNSFLVLMIIPQNLALFLLGLGFVFFLIRFRRLAFLFILSAALWLGLWSLPITSIKVGSFLEDQYTLSSIDELPNADAIVVLGGNTGANRHNWFEVELDTDSAHRRVDTADELYTAGKAPKIIVSGGANQGIISEARGMEFALRNLGVPAEAIIREDFSQTTRENALFTQRTMAEHGINSVLVVTSALHMPRAMGVFNHLQIKAYAAPNPPQIVIPADEPDFNPYLPSRRALGASRSIIKEYLGYWVYQLRGWI